VKYRTIVADPPWDYGSDKCRSNAGRTEVTYLPLPYPVMTTEDICALPVLDLADADCRLFLWTTNRHLHAAFHVAEAWGFDYRQMLVWQKTKSTPIGSVAPTRAEFMLVCRRGHPEHIGRFPSSVITAAPGQHSQKPAVFMDFVEQVSPGPYLELFARRQRLGWDTWGNEALCHVELEAGRCY
jgi:N6-adenosine-specific RNA methylase IME4